MRADYRNPGTSHSITYDEFINEQDEPRFYEIVDNVRTYTSGKSDLHNRVKLHLVMMLRDYGNSCNVGHWIMAPYDIVIRRDPLTVRQPDCGFVSMSMGQH